MFETHTTMLSPLLVGFVPKEAVAEPYSERLKLADYGRSDLFP